MPKMRKKLRKRVEQFTTLWNNEDTRQKAIAFLAEFKGHLAAEIIAVALHDQCKQNELLQEITKYRENK